MIDDPALMRAIDSEYAESSLRPYIISFFQKFRWDDDARRWVVRNPEEKKKEVVDKDAP